MTLMLLAASLLSLQGDQQHCPVGKWSITAEGQTVQVFEFLSSGAPGVGRRRANLTLNEYDASAEGPEISTELRLVECDERGATFEERSEGARVYARWRMLRDRDEFAGIVDFDAPPPVQQHPMRLMKVDGSQNLVLIPASRSRAINLASFSTASTNETIFNLHIFYEQQDWTGCLNLARSIDSSVVDRSSVDNCSTGALVIYRKQSSNFSAIDLYRLAFILHHSQSIEKLVLANNLSLNSCLMGYPRARWLYMASFDRILVNEVGSQVFGTQTLNGHRVDLVGGGNIRFAMPETACHD